MQQNFVQQPQIQFQQPPQQMLSGRQVQELLDQYCLKYKIEKEKVLQNPGYHKFFRDTFAIFLAKQGIIPPQQFQHDPLIKGSADKLKNGRQVPPVTVAIWLELNDIPTPQQWYYDPLTGIGREQTGKYTYKTSLTTAMILSAYGKIPSQCWNHDPSLTTVEGETVAMHLAVNKVLPPPQWWHNPSTTDEYGYTVALILAERGIIPPNEWRHYKKKRVCCYTVESCLKRNKVNVPPQWDTKVKDEFSIVKFDPKIAIAYIKPKNSTYFTCGILCGCTAPEFMCCNCPCGILEICVPGLGLMTGSLMCCYGPCRKSCCSVCCGGFCQALTSPCCIGCVSSCCVGCGMICK